MMIDVKMANPATFRLKSRADLAALVRRSPAQLGEESARSVTGWVKWNVEDPEWQSVRMQQIRPNSIAYVREVQREERELFLMEQGVTAEPAAPALEQA